MWLTELRIQPCHCSGSGHYGSTGSIPNVMIQPKKKFFFFVLLFRANPTAFGNSQARGRIRAIAAGLRHSHSDARSLTHRVRPGIKLTCSWIPVWFVTSEPQQEHQLFFFFFFNLRDWLAFTRKREVSSEVDRRIKGTDHNYIQTLEVGKVM